MMKVLFIEPPKDVWFVMGEYLPPPYGIIQLAAYLEREVKNVEIRVLDCNAQQVDWKAMAQQIESFNPDIVACSALASCNTYVVLRTFETAKRVQPHVLTVAGGQHFTATAQDSLAAYPEIDVIVRGEGEITFTDLVNTVANGSPFSTIQGISFRRNGEIIHTPSRPLIVDLNELPYPGYHFVKEFVHKYHFRAMSGRQMPYVLIEGSRGCPHRCMFCSQWCFWQGVWRTKSPQRIADEIDYCFHNYGSRFVWLTDDNFGVGQRARTLANKIIQKGIADELMWFTQARCDDIITHQDTLPILRKSGLRWVLLGVENARQSTLDAFRKNITPDDAKQAVKLLQQHDIFAQAMFIIGERQDTVASIAEARAFINELDPDFVVYAILTPFPGTELFNEAKQNGWIEDLNWANYDMVHAIMPTETLSRNEVQQELYNCYRSFYGSWKRRLQGVFSRNELKRRVYRFMLSQGIIQQLKDLF
jgi:anaerobic magnesium-protoporphyrin IX monomethyl ester cyclase